MQTMRKEKLKEREERREKRKGSTEGRLKGRESGTLTRAVRYNHGYIAYMYVIVLPREA
jgi:hypothetical protein